MTARQTLWKEIYGGSKYELHVDVSGFKRPFTVGDTFDRTLYVTLIAPTAHGGGGVYEISYWALEPPKINEDPLMVGDWVDLPEWLPLEEAKQVAENIVRLNLGGWP